jgi:hypothetical protein
MAAVTAVVAGGWKEGSVLVSAAGSEEFYLALHGHSLQNAQDHGIGFLIQYTLCGSTEYTKLFNP